MSKKCTLTCRSAVPYPKDDNADEISRAIVTLALGGLRQEDGVFEVRLSMWRDPESKLGKKYFIPNAE